MSRLNIQSESARSVTPPDANSTCGGLQRQQTSCYSMDEVDPNSLRTKIERYRLPKTLKKRLLSDSLNGGKHYSYMTNISQIDTLPPNTGYTGRKFGCFVGNRTMLVEAGHVGLYQCNDDFHFLAPGQHSYSAFGTDYFGQAALNTIDTAVVNGPTGFITISEGHLGVLLLAGEFRILAPGSYQWCTTAVTEVKSVAIADNQFSLGPYTVVSVPVGGVAVTTYHGEIRVLGYDGAAPPPSSPPIDPRSEAADGVVVGGGDATAPRPMMKNGDSPNEPLHTPKSPSEVCAKPTSLIVPSMEFSDAPRTFFLDDARWRFENFLSLKQQTDRLEGNDLLSRDNVEVLMVAMAHWQIVDPMKAVVACSTTMNGIQKNVDSIVRATIARIVAGTALGHGGVSGATGRQGGETAVATGTVMRPDADGDDDADLAHLMLSHAANQHMDELRSHMSRMGIEVLGIYIPEKRIKNADTRSAVARQAVIYIHAEAQRAASDAEAYSTRRAAAAKAESIRLLGEAHENAGHLLGDPSTTQARLALSQASGKSLEGADLTVFSGMQPNSMPMMMSVPQ